MVMLDMLDFDVSDLHYGGDNCEIYFSDICFEVFNNFQFCE